MLSFFAAVVYVIELASVLVSELSDLLYADDLVLISETIV